MRRTGDPHADFDAWEAEQQAELDKLPKCDYCGEPIVGFYLYDINDELLCEDCLNEHFRKRTDDYIE
jgi:formylmethanofuran dehydrogenase subunit E